MTTKDPNPDGTAMPAALANFDRLPDSAHVRAPVVAEWRGTSVVTVWRHSRTGLLPKPKKLSPNVTGWNVGELRRAARPAGTGS